MNDDKRKLLMYFTGGFAACVGGMYAWHKVQMPAPVDDVMASLWASQFTGLKGEKVALASYRGKPLILNFWATWCPPCVNEMPLINSFFIQSRSKNLQIVGIAVDNAGPVQQFVRAKNIQFPIVLAGMAGVELSSKLGNKAKALPFSVLIQFDGTLAQRKIGELTEDELKIWLESAN